MKVHKQTWEEKRKKPNMRILGFHLGKTQLALSRALRRPSLARFLPDAPSGAWRTLALPLRSPLFRELGLEKDLGSGSFLSLSSEGRCAHPIPKPTPDSPSTQSGARCLVKSVPRFEPQAFCDPIQTPSLEQKGAENKRLGVLKKIPGFDGGGRL